MQPLAPYTLANGDPCYGAYLFRLEEDEATLSVAVLGICGKPVVRDPEVEDGDRVEVSATIQAPSHGGTILSFKGPKTTTEEESVVQAVADRILPISGIVPRWCRLSRFPAPRPGSMVSTSSRLLNTRKRSASDMDSLYSSGQCMC